MSLHNQAAILHFRGRQKHQIVQWHSQTKAATDAIEKRAEKIRSELNANLDAFEMGQFGKANFDLSVQLLVKKPIVLI